ncbi:MAG TPA: FimV/HubP family polar landmark protein, partial [Steroidobacteraceae bacterium]
MIAKRSSRALAVLLALPSAAFALGLGDIRLLSALNAPLDAEIDLVDVTPEEMSTVQAQLASRDTFTRYGLDWPPYLSGVQVRTVRMSDGREVIKLKSNDPISDPFVTLLVEVNWARGKLVREYTMLLDPPVFTPGQPQVASAPVTAPSAGAGPREGSIARATEPAAPAPPPVPAAAAAPVLPTPVAAPAPAAEAAPAAETAASRSEAGSARAEAAGPAAEAAPSPADSGASANASPPPEPAASSSSAVGAAAPPPPSASSAESEGSHTVRHGETLSQIASGVAGEKVSSAHTRSWMLAIYQANPRAFQGNMNVLHSGAVLRIPDAETAAAVSPAEASSEIRRQYAAWRGTSAASSESAAATQPGRLKLVPPSESASAGSAPGASAGESGALQGRVRELEGQLAESKRLLEMKEAELARMQAQLAAKQQPAAPPPAAAQPPAPSAPAQQPPAAQVAPPPAPPPPPAPEEKPPEAIAPPPPPVVARAPAPTPKPAAPPSEPSGSFLGTLVGYWWVLLIAAVAAGAVAALRILRSRRASQFDASLGRLAVAGADAELDLGFQEHATPSPAASAPAAGGAARNFAASDTAVRTKPSQAREPAFVVEETGTHERPRLTPSGAPAAPTARHVATDETISSETAINLDQGDPLAEADFHMAYGLYDQAA